MSIQSTRHFADGESGAQRGGGAEHPGWEGVQYWVQIMTLPFTTYGSPGQGSELYLFPQLSDGGVRVRTRTFQAAVKGQ